MKGTVNWNTGVGGSYGKSEARDREGRVASATGDRQQQTEGDSEIGNGRETVGGLKELMDKRETDGGENKNW